MATSRTSLTLADCGNLAAITAQPETVKQLVVATIFGVCTGISERKSPDKITKFQGLMGAFAMRPAGEGEALESGYLYFPPAFNALLAPLTDKLKTAERSEVRFAYDLVSVRAKNDAGYSTNFVVRSEPAIVNRLEEYISAITPAKPDDKKK